ncbi:hypothetical protein [Pseudomonas sp. KNUC1026]|uniref:hypothetical protein n=1 Tax=Pseudomonas sp. KNUC1026 TaxID=2893890 RepID=UPI001F3F3DE8|nr:hypothetical protein [Pseudomonas sp. KNUC1026]UFH51800.1 hypothetical protein LN139_12410 [Pseudomonas sp. KNUC1026]
MSFRQIIFHCELKKPLRDTDKLFGQGDIVIGEAASSADEPYQGGQAEQALNQSS